MSSPEMESTATLQPLHTIYFVITRNLIDSDISAFTYNIFCHRSYKKSSGTGGSINQQERGEHEPNLSSKERLQLFQQGKQLDPIWSTRRQGFINQKKTSWFGGGSINKQERDMRLI
ncbi:hypothetical protein DOY81_014345 [Sarcophaga bullata]|nr:hypothetical protein DOY81_014345 [Sarcophaga bullata]